MAEYKREFLVPYLQDVCSMEMLCSRLEDSIRTKQYECDKAKKYITYQVPEPELEDIDKGIQNKWDSSWDLIGVGIFFGIVGGLGIILISPILNFLGIPSRVLLYVLVIICAAWCIFWSVGWASDAARYTESAKEYNQNLLNQYEQDKQNAEKNRAYYRQVLDKCCSELDTLKGELDEAEDTLYDLYHVNIIPSRYRNKYVAYYLYDYFYTSRETDLDKIIQTLLLDEIVQRLDYVIQQSKELLINQRYEIAMQENQNRVAAENHRKKMKQLARMEHNQEKQQDYLAMIESNSRVTELLTTLDYFERHL